MTATARPPRAAVAPAAPAADPLANAWHLELERSILAVCLDGRHPDAWLQVREHSAGAAAFHVREHRLLALVIDQLVAESRPVDVLAVAEAAKQTRFQGAMEALRALDGEQRRGALSRDEATAYEESLLAGLGGYDAIARIAESFGSPLGLARNAQALDRYHRQRQAIAEIGDLARLIQGPDGATQVAAIADRAASRLSEIAGGSRVAMTLGACAAEVLDAHDRAREAGGGTGRTGSWGFAPLDHAMPLDGNRLVCVTGDPGGGKTSLTLSAIRATAERLGPQSVAVINLEQGGNELVSILIARELGVPRRSLINGNLSSEQREAAEAIRAWYDQHEVFVRDTSKGTTPADALAWVQQRQRRSGGRLHLVVVDHVGLLDAAHDRETEYQVVSKATKLLKRLANSGLCVLMVVQQNREGRKAVRDKQGGVVAKPEPRLEDLRGSGTIEQDSDGVLALWCRTDPKAPVREVDLVGLKNRGDGGFTIPATFFAADGQRYERRRAPIEPEERRQANRAAAIDRAAKQAGEPRDSEDLFQ